jgi:CheY-like chemotaxis protein
MKEKYDAVFLDVWMPAPDGFEVAQRMRSAGFNQKTPLVMITGDADPGVLKRGFESGANYFLFKPIDRRGLLRLVRATQGSIQNEKRRFQRVGVRCKVTVSSGSERVEGHTLDVSLNGVLVEASRAFEQNAGVDVEIKLPAGAPVRARGRVMRKIDNRMGILLDNMQSNESARLQEFLLPLILSAIEQEATSAGN